MNNEINHQLFQLLFVDDNIMLQVYFGEFLRSKGIRFDIANNGIEAVNMVKNNAYNLVIMDIEMPKMNGIEATLEIRKFNKHVPIVAFSALKESEIDFGIAKEMMNDYYFKNNDTVSICSLIEKYHRQIA